MGTTNDGAGRRPRPRAPAERSGATPPGFPSQRAPGGAPAPREVVVPLDSSDESLDRVVAAARDAQAAGTILRLVPAPGEDVVAGGAVARDRLAQRLDLAAEVARALCPDLTVEVAMPVERTVEKPGGNADENPAEHPAGSPDG